VKMKVACSSEMLYPPVRVCGVTTKKTTVWSLPTLILWRRKDSFTPCYTVLFIYTCCLHNLDCNH
jgi:hypothetical protein